MRAIILAAGVGERLRPFSEQHPKCLLRFGDKTLLHHHLEYLSASGVEDITIVVGHLADQIKAVVAQAACPVPVQLILNPHYRAGSALSLLSAAGIFTSAASLIMDADILCGQEMFERLIAAPFPNCILADSKFEDTGEEVKIVVREDGRVWKLGKCVGGEGQVVGESVGMFKFTPQTGQRLAYLLGAVTETDLNIEYELAIDKLVKDVRVEYEAVGDLAWTEIDFWEDVERARVEVYPRLKGRGSSYNLSIKDKVS